MTRAPAPRPLPAAAALAAVAAAALTGCVGDGRPAPGGLEITPAPTASEESAPAAEPPRPADDDDCFDVAQLHLSLTLLPLAEDEQAQELDLSRTAADAGRRAERVPAAVQDDFAAAAELLEGYGHELEPRELDELRTRLQPVDTWLGRHCSA
ncbi:hypothetical protein [Kocuria palustris]|uniref:hypothetical protein n=1 Tax=Kocuria palustris TaxID=71999 RepID=UPI0011A67E10|nr:hypothetical protein [Kocuria palustris]